MKSIIIPVGPQPSCQSDLAEQLQSRPQVEQVVDGAESRGDRATEQQRSDLRGRETDRHRQEVCGLIDEQEEAGNEQECSADRQAAAARHGDRVDPPRLGRSTIS